LRPASSTRLAGATGEAETTTPLRTRACAGREDRRTHQRTLAAHPRSAVSRTRRESSGSEGGASSDHSYESLPTLGRGSASRRPTEADPVGARETRRRHRKTEGATDASEAHTEAESQGGTPNTTRREAVLRTERIGAQRETVPSSRRVAFQTLAPTKQGERPRSSVFRRAGRHTDTRRATVLPRGTDATGRLRARKPHCRLWQLPTAPGCSGEAPVRRGRPDHSGLTLAPTPRALALVSSAALVILV
jgi:hypothetical protein